MLAFQALLDLASQSRISIVLMHLSWSRSRASQQALPSWTW